MPEYTPIQFGNDVHTAICEAIDLKWKQEVLRVDLKLEDDRVVQISFARAEVVRLSDIFASKYDSEDYLDSDPLHKYLAFEMSESAFFKMHEKRLTALDGTFKHYRFVSTHSYLDVLSSTVPKLELASMT